ncbi:putative gustatory receptor 10b [Drosophila guanche]|uniref:Gustatory receptor n=1 Tax=Drosophila guanche TaxID=7266 RepID=A0A3B0KS69_DROGU|nr:putative gustatory receptor 10b [Drosophila guanche]SPP86778.1 blast:Putative gustatory receptor 10b [Drosophila guanche]
MGPRWMYTLLLRFWMIQGLVLGATGHYYSVSRRRLVPCGVLRWYSWLLMLATLLMYGVYWRYAENYLVEGMFRRHRFVQILSEGTVRVMLLTLVLQSVLRVFREREVCAVYNELRAMRQRSKVLQLQEEHSRFYYVMFFAKLIIYLQNFNCVLSVYIVVEVRTFTVCDFMATFYFAYISLVRECLLMSYVLLLLQLGEALRVNGEHPRTSYAALMRQLRRQERLLRLVQRVHRLFDWQVLAVLVFQLYFNTTTFYVAYSFLAAPSQSGSGSGSGWGSGFRVWSIKFLLTAAAFISKLCDGLLLHIVGGHLLAQGNKACASPQVEAASTHVQAAQRQMEMAYLKRAIRAANPENRVLGMFSMDMGCAFAIISSSLSYGIIIMQLGYIHSK